MTYTSYNEPIESRQRPIKEALQTNKIIFLSGQDFEILTIGLHVP